MTAAFDTTVPGQTFSRVQSLHIRYTAPMTAQAVVELQDHVPLTDGTFAPIGSVEALVINIKPEDMDASVPLLDPGTGAPLGAEMTIGQVFLGILAVIRSRQAA